MTIKLTTSSGALSNIFLVFILTCVLNVAPCVSQAPPEALVGPCEKNMQLNGLAPEKVVSNKTGLAIHYKLADKFPSKKAFNALEDQLLKCGWKPYNRLEFLVNDADWVSYLEERADKETVMVHRFGRSFIDQTKQRLVSVLTVYFSRASNTKETMRLNAPNNDSQLITIQYMPFNEEEYRTKIKEYKQRGK